MRKVRHISPEEFYANSMYSLKNYLPWYDKLPIEERDEFERVFLECSQRKGKQETFWGETVIVDQ